MEFVRDCVDLLNHRSGISTALSVSKKNIDNLNAVSLLEKNLDKLHWQCLSLNPNGISFLERNLDKINWSSLSANPNAISILENNQDKIKIYLVTQMRFQS